MINSKREKTYVPVAFAGIYVGEFEVLSGCTFSEDGAVSVYIEGDNNAPVKVRRHLEELFFSPEHGTIIPYSWQQLPNWLDYVRKARP